MNPDSTFNNDGLFDERTRWMDVGGSRFGCRFGRASNSAMCEVLFGTASDWVKEIFTIGSAATTLVMVGPIVDTCDAAIGNCLCLLFKRVFEMYRVAQSVEQGTENPRVGSSNCLVTTPLFRTRSGP